MPLMFSEATDIDEVARKLLGHGLVVFRGVDVPD